MEAILTIPFLLTIKNNIIDNTIKANKLIVAELNIILLITPFTFVIYPRVKKNNATILISIFHGNFILGLLQIFANVKLIIKIKANESHKFLCIY